MYSKEITFDPIELYTEATSRTSPIYMEAVKDFSKYGEKGKALVQSFLKSIKQKLYGKKYSPVEKEVSKSIGNIDDLKHLGTIETALTLMKGVPDAKTVSQDIQTVMRVLKKNKSLYEEGYRKKIELVTIEYENAAYMIISASMYAMALYYHIEFSNGKLRITHNTISRNNNGGVFFKTLNELAKQLSSKDHDTYLKSLLDVIDDVPVDTHSDVKTEAVVSSVREAIDLIDAIFNGIGKAAKYGYGILSGIWKTLFGILPLMRTITYLRLKHKANQVISLEEQVRMIQENINQLNKEKVTDPEKKKIIIAKQQAYIDAYNKKCEKLRAELMVTEKEAVDAMNKNKGEIKEVPKQDVPSKAPEKKEDKKEEKKEEDDDFVLD